VTWHAAPAGGAGVIVVIAIIIVAAIIIVIIVAVVIVIVIVVVLQEHPGVAAQQLPAASGWLTQPDTVASGTAPAVVIVVISCSGCHSTECHDNEHSQQKGPSCWRRHVDGSLLLGIGTG
jgi:nitrogen fixation/metabolism regulation signal transduction histidine kinase